MSATTMNTMPDKKARWWHEPMVWLIIALPIAAVIGGITTVMIAVKNADTKVNQDYVKEGMGVNLVVERDRKAAELGAAANLAAEPGKLSLQLDGRFASPPKALTLTLAHPTDSRQDMILMLQDAGAGRYTAVYADVPAGKRNLVLEPGDKTWRLTGHWQAPFSGSTQLTAATPISSPQHSPTQP